jgi:hypothetical protein
MVIDIGIDDRFRILEISGLGATFCQISVRLNFWPPQIKTRAPGPGPGLRAWPGPCETAVIL